MAKIYGNPITFGGGQSNKEYEFDIYATYSNYVAMQYSESKTNSFSGWIKLGTERQHISTSGILIIDVSNKSASIKIYGILNNNNQITISEVSQKNDYATSIAPSIGARATINISKMFEIYKDNPVKEIKVWILD